MITKLTNNPMKTKIILFVTILLGLVSCNKDFSFSDPVRLQSDYLLLDAMGGTTPIIIEANKAWTCSLEGDNLWGRIDVTSGKGLSQVSFEWDANAGLARRMEFCATAEGETVKMGLIQKSGLESVQLSFNSLTFNSSTTDRSIEVPVSTNLPESDMSRVSCEVEYTSADEGEWLQFDGLSESIARFTLSETSVTRSALVTLKIEDAFGESYSTSVTIIQG